MYRLIIWSAAVARGESMGCLDFFNKESAVSAYRFMLHLAMEGRDKISCIELYNMHDDENCCESLYSATFPD